MIYSYVAALHISQVEVFNYVLRDARRGRRLQWDDELELCVIPFDCSKESAEKLKLLGISFATIPDL